VVCDSLAPYYGGVRGSDGNIYFSPGAFRGLVRVSANGGIAQAITWVEKTRGSTWPELLPNGKPCL
jgi:hypothetical protein